MPRRLRAYRFQAFGYELTVRQSGNGWIGFMREEPNGKPQQVTVQPAELDATKLEVCRAARRESGILDKDVAVDPCEHSLAEWQPFTLFING